MIRTLAHHNSVAGRVHVEVALASGVRTPGAAVGVVADDRRWATTTHGATVRPSDISMPQLMSRYMIDNVEFLKVDIEGAEFGLLAANVDLGWLTRVNQIAIELHPLHGDTRALIQRLMQHGFHVELSDNDGNPLEADAADIAYAYCHRARATTSTAWAGTAGT